MSMGPGLDGSQSEETNITVAVRCRGRNEREIQAKSSVVVSVPDVTGTQEVSINTTGDVGIAAQMNSKTYTVDKVFGPSASQSLLFEEIARPLFEDFMKGYNCTVLVYGMTSTGKTYTMTGDEKLYDGELSDSAGIIPRILFRLFDTLEMQNEDYVIKCSFVELYNEELKDLLEESDFSSAKRLRIYDSSTTESPSNNSRGNSRINSSPVPTTSANLPKSKKLRSAMLASRSDARRQPVVSKSSSAPESYKRSQLHQESNSGIYIQNLQEFHITSAREGIKLLQKGLKHRQVASTKMNDFSSRSHTIFTITIYRQHEGEMFRVSKMNLVDLAGSENISRSGAQNQRAKEAGSINQSLLTLGRVINSVADKGVHIPFRESKLTRLLQDSLGGNTKTALIATISPAKINAEETCSTLEYASKAKNIKNKPQLGSFVMKDILVKSITAELAKVKSDLLSTKSKDGVFMSQENYKELTNDLESYKTEVQECKRAMERLTSQNTLLLKDKKASNEVNELQRIKLGAMQDTIKELYGRMERQHQHQAELVDVVTELRSNIIKMQGMVKDVQDRESNLHSKIKYLFDEQIRKLRKLLEGSIKGLKDISTDKNTVVKTDLDEARKEIVSILEEIQASTQKTYETCIEQIIEETPTLLADLDAELVDVEAFMKAHYTVLAEKLSDVSEEYNNLRQYLNDHFFKNNHEEILDAHVNKTYYKMKESSELLFSGLKNMVDEFITESKAVVVDSLKLATSDVIKNEMTLFEPHKNKWEESLELINECDSVNHSNETTLLNATSKIRSTLTSSVDSMNSAISNIQTQIKQRQNAVAVLQDNRVLNKHFSEIENKNSALKKRIISSAASVTNTADMLDDINQSLQEVLGSGSQELGAGTNLQEVEDIIKKSEAVQNSLITSPEKMPLSSLPNLNTAQPSILRSNPKSPGKELASPKKHNITIESGDVSGIHLQKSRRIK